MTLELSRWEASVLTGDSAWGGHPGAGAADCLGHRRKRGAGRIGAAVRWPRLHVGRGEFTACPAFDSPQSPLRPRQPRSTCA